MLPAPSPIAPRNLSGTGGKSDMREPSGAVPLTEVARATGGRIDGDAAAAVTSLMSLASATADSLAFYTAPAGRDALSTTAAAAVLLRAEHAPWFSRHKIIVADPQLAYARVSHLFVPPSPPPPERVHPSAVVAASAHLGQDAVIGPHCVIGERVRIAERVIIGPHTWVGDDCTIGPDTALEVGVRLYPRTRIGQRCLIAANVVLGAAGFGYAQVPEDDGAWIRIAQLGGVRIGDDVDVGAHTTIDRGALDDTVIGDGVKLDNHIHIAHNVRVGDHTIMAGCVAIAGGAVIGRRCRLGGRAAILGHLSIADDVTVNANSFVARSLTRAGAYSSMIPVQPAARWRKTVAHLRRLESLAHTVKTLRGERKK